MAAGRNWMKTLHKASFKGVPFQTEKDDERGGRRLAVHEFPMRDTPFIEDLGESKRDYDVTAYVASDRAENEAAALVAVLSQRGAGVLVLPTHGPITVRCQDFSRSREKDRAGLIAFTAKFLREGAASSLISVASLANLVFAQADTVSAAVGAFAQAAIAWVQQPDFVVDGANDAIADGAAMLEAVRTGEAIDPVVSATQRVAIQALFNVAPQTVGSSTGVNADNIVALVTIARALGDGMEPGNAIAAFAPIVEGATASQATPFFNAAAQNADTNKRVVYLAIRIAAATAYVEAITAATIPDRQAAITLRANVAEYFDAIMGEMSPNDADIYRAVLDLRNSAVEYLSRAILDRAPVVEVGSNFSMPSLWWAHRLYRDPTRSTELAARNRVAHPSFMPTDFEALSR